MNGAQFILSALEDETVGQIFLVPGGTIDPIMQAFGEVTYNVEPIVAAHEAGAGFMADGFARASGSFGVCACIGGPGAANLMGPLASAYADKSQVLALVGQISTDVTGKGAFQDGSPAGLDDLAYLRAVTNWSQEVPSSALLPARLNAAVREMLGTPAGPSCLTLPMQVLVEPVAERYRHIDRVTKNPPCYIDTRQARNAGFNMTRAEKVVIYAGSGVSRLYRPARGLPSYRGADLLLEVAEKFEIPVATTLRAKGVFPEDHRLSLGVFGYAGTRHAHETLLNDDIDMIIAIGTSLNQRNTMKWSDRLKRAKIVHVDVSGRAIDRNYPSDIKVCADAAEFLDFLNTWQGTERQPFPQMMKNNAKIRREWIQTLKTKPRWYDIDVEGNDCDQEPIHPGHAVRVLDQVAPANTVALVDSGAHRAFMAHYWTATKPNSYLTATSLAPMGWAIPAAIGAKFARPDRPHVVVTGDGCMLMHGIELQTAARYRVPLVLVVINNSALGNVYLRTIKKDAPMGEASQAVASLETHDWSAFAKSLGASGTVVHKPRDLLKAFEQAFEHNDGPFIVDVRCDPTIKTPIGPWAPAQAAAHD